MFTVYALKHDDDVIYIGATKNSLKKRLKDHRVKSNPCQLVREYMNKYGKDVITIEPIQSDISTIKIAHEIESSAVALWHPCCNATDTGQGGFRYGDSNHPMKRPEVVKKVSAARKGSTQSDEQRAKMIASWTPERRTKQSDAFSGKNNSMFEIGKNHPNYGKKHSPDTIAKMRHPVWKHYDEVIKMLSQGTPLRDIGKRFGCSVNPIRSIRDHHKANQE